jgi:hypothetical protein
MDKDWHGFVLVDNEDRSLREKAREIKVGALEDRHFIENTPSDT